MVIVKSGHVNMGALKTLYRPYTILYRPYTILYRPYTILYGLYRDYYEDYYL